MNLGSRIASGAAWMVLFRLTERIVGLASTIILARLLTPEDFGLVAMATTVIAFLEIFTMNDFASAIIHNPAPTRDDYNTAWSMEVMLGVGAGAVIAALAVPASIFFDDPRLVPVLLVLAIYPILDAACNVGCVDFRKHLDFRKDFALQVTRKISGFVVCIPLAFLLRNHWALVWGILAARVGALAASYYMHPFRPRWSMAASARIWSFTKWIMVSNALAFLNTRTSHLVIGRLGGTRSLGLYSVAFDLANLPTSELSMPINRAVFPGYSQFMGDVPRLKLGFLRVFGVVALAVLPAGIGVAAIAHLLVPLVLGDKWLDAVPLIQILAVSGAMAALQTNVDSVYLAMGRTRLRAQMYAVQLVFLLPLMVWLASRHGIIGAAWAVLITAVIVTTYNLWQVTRLVAVTASELFQHLWRPLIATALMAVVLGGLRTLEPESLSVAVWLLATVGAGAVAYGALLSLLWWVSGRPDGSETWVIATTRAVIDRLKAGRAG